MKTAEDILKSNAWDMISITPKTIVKDAVHLMTVKKIGAVIVKEGKKVKGIWTERDLMRNLLDENFNLENSIVGDYMASELHTASHSDTVYALMDKYLGLRTRHLMIEKNGEYLGILSMGDIIKATIQEKNEELKQLNSIVSWEYYEKWN